jgi:LPXTG cell wall anchor motif
MNLFTIAAGILAIAGAVLLHVASKKRRQHREREREQSAQFFADQRSGICHVHNIKMELQTVKIRYGLPLFRDADDLRISREQIPQFLATEAEQFPNARPRCDIGGCMIRPDSPKTRDGYVCPKCVDAKQRFLAERRAEGQ